MNSNEETIAKYMACFEKRRDKGVISDDNLRDFKNILNDTLEEANRTNNYGKDYTLDLDRLNLFILYYSFKNIHKHLESTIALNSALIQANHELGQKINVENLLAAQINKSSRFLGELMFIPVYLDKGGDIYRYDKGVSSIHLDGRSRDATLLMLDTSMLDTLHEVGCINLYEQWIYKHMDLMDSSSPHYSETIRPEDTADYLNRASLHLGCYDALTPLLVQFNSKIIHIKHGFNHEDFDIKKEHKEFLEHYFIQLDKEILKEMEKFFVEKTIGYNFLKMAKSLKGIEVTGAVENEANIRPRSSRKARPRL